MSKKNIFIFFLDDLLSTHLGSFFGYAGTPGVLRVTRDGDVLVDLEEEDPESIPDVVKSRIGKREIGKITRVQYAAETKQSLFGEVAAHFQAFQAPDPPSP